MIMPAIFGAFGNFLLPTQLGVHDVAFPRLNSAAFWFLPGGLIMLCQLVCTDRRYARMNCFNIRELQGILKNKFFTDLVNSHEHKLLLEKSMIGLRFKTNNTINLDSDMLSFYNFGTHNVSLINNTSFLNYNSYKGNKSNSTPVIKEYDYFLIDLFGSNISAISLFRGLNNLFLDILTIFVNFSYVLPFKIFNYESFTSFISNNLSILNFFGSSYQAYNHVVINRALVSRDFRAHSLLNSNLGSDSEFKNFFSENSSSQRLNRFNNILVNYDYKTGHYIGDWDKQYPYIINSLIEVARGIRKPT
jgi:hypothetical protein